jgi:hypothetical protein
MVFGKYIVLAVLFVMSSFPVTTQERETVKNWVSFSPPDGGFRIELPKMPTKSEKFNPGKVDETDYFRCTKSLLGAYRFPIRADSPVPQFALGVFDVSGCRRRAKDFNLETKLLVLFFSADDPNDHIISEEVIKVNGYRGRVFITKTGAGNYVWEMFVDTGRRIYWLVYATDDPDGRSSAEAKRILRSFRPGEAQHNNSFNRTR